MTHLRYLISLLSVVIFAFYTTSCNKKTSTIPQITLTANSIVNNAIITAGDSAKIEFNVKATSDLSLIEIINSAGTVIKDYDSLSTSLTYSYSFVSIAGSQVYSIIVSDIDGYSTKLELNVTTKSKIAALKIGSVSDILGYKYKTVEIGNQTWMAENLRTKLYNDGHQIPNVKVDSMWILQTNGAQCTYGNTENIDSIKTLGRLYNWYAVSTGKLCPSGWHVPTDTDWTTLETYLTDYGYGFDESGNDIAKSLAVKTGWETSIESGDVGNNQSTNNITGFSANASGERNELGEFHSFSKTANWWSFTGYYTDYAYYHHIGAYTNDLETNLQLKSVGLSVRCIKD